MKRILLFIVLLVVLVFIVLGVTYLVADNDILYWIWNFFSIVIGFFVLPLIWRFCFDMRV
jgi:hypothetical protein